ncbi:MAG: phosphotransferase [Bacteroidales bacterium]|nr:phosphotransferase [Bacteroidales bacterium]
MNNVATTVSQLFQSCYGILPDKITKLPVSGSDRSYFLVTGSDGRQAIATVGADTAENRAFIYLARHFRSHGIPVPEVYAVSDDEMVYIQEYLGDTSLSDMLSPDGSYSTETKKIIERCIRLLPHIQMTGACRMDFSRCYPEQRLSMRTISNDLSYFKYCFLKSVGLDFDECALDSELESLRDIIYDDAKTSVTFMVRDFQSRNIMLKDGNPYVIDFQGGRIGPAQYDLVSFLWQAKAAFPDEIKQHMIEAYIDEAASISPKFDKDKFRTLLPVYVLFRILQTLGAYGFRGWTERKPHFLRSIPNGVKSLFNFFASPMDTEFANAASRFPYLKELSARIADSQKILDLKAIAGLPQYNGLTLTVSSFSYKRGVPYDLSGNGGGFVFDCRGINNPGRYEEYRSLTGLDAPVRRFLEEDGEIISFLSNATAIVEKSVECYMQRGFSSLCVAFGCTGGRHRSVYSAETLAHHFAVKYPLVRVVVHHREQNLLTVLTTL